MTEESFFTRTIGPVEYVDKPADVWGGFKRNPDVGMVITRTKLPIEVVQELPKINQISQRCRTRHDFNQACSRTRLAEWVDEQMGELGTAYQRWQIFRDNDVWVGWHVDDMGAASYRAFLQISGARLKVAAPPSPVRLAFNPVVKTQLESPEGLETEAYLRKEGIPITELGPGQLGVFGERALHASGDGQRLRAIAI